MRPVEPSGGLEAVAGLLWLHAGGRGRIARGDGPYALADTHAVLLDPGAAGDLAARLGPGVVEVFIAADDPDAAQHAARRFDVPCFPLPRADALA